MARKPSCFEFKLFQNSPSLSLVPTLLPSGIFLAKASQCACIGVRLLKVWDVRFLKGLWNPTKYSLTLLFSLSLSSSIKYNLFDGLQDSRRIWNSSTSPFFHIFRNSFSILPISFSSFITPAATWSTWLSFSSLALEIENLFPLRVVNGVCSKEVRPAMFSVRLNGPLGVRSWEPPAGG